MSTRIEAPYYPIVYLRGYAATMDEVDATTADPYMGFNLGSTMMRQDPKGDPDPFIFESPVVRLMKDHGYADAFDNGGFRHKDAPVRSIWVFRYYEKVSRTLGAGERETIPGFARDLRAFILQIRDAVCGQDAQGRAAFKVHLVAHSMGGLICRAYLQKVCRMGTGNLQDDQELELQPGAGGDHLVDKVFTYGTPHGGIEFGGINVPALGALDRLHVSNFNRDNIRGYLGLDANAPANSLGDAFPADRFFCFIGSNYRDYGAFLGISKRVTGPMSDGLVMIENAAVRGAPRAVSHLSHSGPFGIVNSEAGYQNLRRFLFGNVRVTARLLVEELTLPKKVQQKLDDGHQVRGSYYFDAATQVRGAASYYLNERRVMQQSAILRPYDKLVQDRKPVYLFSGYLAHAGRAPSVSDRALMFAIELGVHVPRFEVDRRWWFDQHFEGFMFHETIAIAWREGSIKYGLASEKGLGVATQTPELVTRDDGTRVVRIPLSSKRNLRPGFKGVLELTAEDWK